VCLQLADLDSLLNDEGMPEQLEQDIGLFKSYDDEIESLLEPSPDGPEADHGLWSTVTELFGSKVGTSAVAIRVHARTPSSPSCSPCVHITIG